MKAKLVLFAILMPLTSLAIEPLTQSAVLGVKSGTYEGSGKLLSKSFGTPDLDFKSTRIISGNIIEAKTSAKFMGLEVAKASAKLKVVPTSKTNFDIVDIESGKVCGSGVCGETACSFSATVMNGELSLQETWAMLDNGFSVISASQVYQNKKANYAADFFNKK